MKTIDYNEIKKELAKIDRLIIPGGYRLAPEFGADIKRQAEKTRVISLKVKIIFLDTKED